MSAEDASGNPNVRQTAAELAGYEDAAASQLSHGRQQQLEIGMAAALEPDLLLLDEPSEGIQPSIVDQISRDMRAINEGLGTPILFVEQNLGVIRDLADRCYAMERGEIVDEVGPQKLEDERAIADFLAV